MAKKVFFTVFPSFHRHCIAQDSIHLEGPNKKFQYSLEVWQEFNFSLHCILGLAYLVKMLVNKAIYPFKKIVKIYIVYQLLLQ